MLLAGLLLAGLLLSAPVARAVVVSCVQWFGADGAGCALPATAARTHVEAPGLLLLWVTKGDGTGALRAPAAAGMPFAGAAFCASEEHWLRL